MVLNTICGILNLIVAIVAFAGDNNLAASFWLLASCLWFYAAYLRYQLGE